MEAVQERMFIFEWRQTQEFSYRKFLQSNPQKKQGIFFYATRSPNSFS